MEAINMLAAMPEDAQSCAQFAFSLQRWMYSSTESILSGMPRASSARAARRGIQLECDKAPAEESGHRRVNL